MLIRLRVALLLGTLCSALAAQAHQTHPFAFGQPGKATEVTKTIHVQANDQMRLVFDRQDIHPGDVVRFVITNVGHMAHEFGISDQAGTMAHQQEMLAMPDMAHDEPNVVSLPPGATKTLIWRFKGLRQHQLVFACNVPGHYQAGMVLRLTVQ